MALADRVFAPHYARPLLHGCIVARVAMRGSASEDAPAVSELLLGERFAVVDVGGEWAWGYACDDGYVGYVPVAALGGVVETTHVVTAPAALVFAAADIKSPVAARLPMGARFAGEASGEFVRGANGFVHRRHLDDAPDPVTVARRLIGTPYRWGGRSGDGIDCSGLVQLAFALCGRALPRDSDQQRVVGDAIPDDAALARGDLVFLPGHVGIMIDADTLLHANAHWMAVVEEPLAAVLARQPAGAGIVARRRPTW